MKKLTTLQNRMRAAVVLFAALFASNVSFAQTAGLTWSLETTIDFSTATYPEDPTIVVGSTKVGTAYDTGNKKQQDIFLATEPAELGGRLAFQAVSNGSGKGWWIRASKGGLWSYNAGRSAAVLDLTTGDRVVFNCTQSASVVMSLVNGNNDPDGPFIYELSEDGMSYICTMIGDGNVGFFGNQSQGYISSIEIYKADSDVSVATYTVKYVDQNGNELKESSTHEGIAGLAPSVFANDKERITVNGVTYIYGSDDAASQLIKEDGSTVVTVVFHLPEPLAYCVYERAGGVIARKTMGEDVEGTSIKVPYRQYNVVDGKLYQKGATNKEYNYVFTLTTDGQEENIEYTATDIENVVYLSEGEDIEGLTLCTSANTAIRSSNSSAAYAADGDVEFTKLSAGSYKLTAVIYDSAKEPNSYWKFFAGETEIANFNCTVVNYQLFTSDEFTITTDDTPLYIGQGGKDTQGIDLIYIVRTAGGTSTGINTVNAQTENGVIYNLQGQQVQKTQKGLYIVDGKKVIVK